MKVLGVLLFLVGLLLAVRVMFFGVQRRLHDDHLAHRAWPLSLAAFLVATGALSYTRSLSGGVTAGWLALVVLIGIAAGGGAWWLVRRSAAARSTDPEDDPRYRFQGHIARVIEPIRAGGAAGTSDNSEPAAVGRIAFNFDGKRYELRARWSAEGRPTDASAADGDVVIERVEGDVAYVEPWTMVEQRL